MRPCSPSAQLSVTFSPLFTLEVASAEPTTAGMPSSRATIAACDVRPPRSVTMPAALGDDPRRDLHDRLPVGIGVLGDEDLAALELIELRGAADHPRGADGEP